VDEIPGGEIVVAEDLGDTAEHRLAAIDRAKRLSPGPVFPNDA
jgi:hypothetical protein